MTIPPRSRRLHGAGGESGDHLGDVDVIDCARWVLAEAWISNGLRVIWGLHDARFGTGEWLGETGRLYRYRGFGEWEVQRPHNYLTRPLGEETSPQLSTEDMRHELAHWLLATEDQRNEVNFGLTSDDNDAEQRALAAERVLSAVIAAASRVVALSLASRNP